jgi:YVTN family beta-propeller protein
MYFLKKVLLSNFLFCITIAGFSQIAVIDTIYLGSKTCYGESPSGVAVNPETNRIYVTNNGSDNVSVIDGSGDSVIATIEVGNEPWCVGVNPETNRIYVVNGDSDNISVIDGSGDSVIATIEVGGNPQEIAVNPQTNRIYVANWYSDNIFVIDGVGDSVIATIEVGNRTENIAVNPETNRVYVSCFNDGTVWVIHDEIAGVEDVLNNPQALNFNIHPNPFSNRTEFTLLVPANEDKEEVKFSIYNVSGRLVKLFSLDSNLSSQTTISWDGKDNTGTDLSSGRYFGILTTGNNKVSKSFILIR